MATILLTWELGGGLGHLVNLQPLAQGLSEARASGSSGGGDLSAAALVLPKDGIELLQTPPIDRPEKIIEPAYTFAQLLCNCGFSDTDRLMRRVEVWRKWLLDLRPSLIVCDHSPTALLASWGLDIRRATIGTGFFCPPDVSPLPNLQSANRRAPNPDQLSADEERVLVCMNLVLDRLGERGLDHVAQLYHPIDEHFLLAFAKLDPYSDRPGATYWGMWPGRFGQPPQWPPGEGKRIFAYLKPFPALPRLLRELQTQPHTTIVYCPAIDPRMRQDFAASHVSFAAQPVDIQQVAEQCDLAILHGTLGTATAMLLAGKPSLQIPIMVEQGLAAMAITRLGAGVMALPTMPNQISAALKLLLVKDQYRVAARAFAEQHADYRPAAAIQGIVDRAEQLAMQGGK